MPSLTETVLVCAAHPDDEVLGCGGAIARHVAAGAEVHALILATGIFSRETATDGEAALGALREAGRSSAAILGTTSITFHDFPDNRMDEIPRLEITKVIEEAVARLKPSVVYTHHSGDLNVDHRRTNDCVSVACRPMPTTSVRELRFFETASSTEWQPAGNFAAFQPNLFVDIEDVLEKKLRALRAYGSEMRGWPHARSLEAIEHLARWRGATAGLHAAEAFVIGRRVEVKEI